MGRRKAEGKMQCTGALNLANKRSIQIDPSKIDISIIYTILSLLPVN